MGHGGHRGGAEDEPRLLVESVGVGVAGVGAGDDLAATGVRPKTNLTLEASVRRGE